MEFSPYCRGGVEGVLFAVYSPALWTGFFLPNVFKTHLQDLVKGVSRRGFFVLRKQHCDISGFLSNSEMED